jgi:hypothetical protein
MGLAGLAACSSNPTAPPANTTQAIALDKEQKQHATVVTEKNVSRQAEDTPPLRKWVLYTRLAGTGTFRVGPGHPPLGCGSLEFATPTSADKVQIFNFQYVGTPLSDFTALTYWTYQSASANPAVLPSINLTIDQNGPTIPGGFATLVYEPIYNAATQGPVVPQVWQDWDAIVGGTALWWLTRDFPGIGPRGTLATWAAWNAVLPAATILGGVGLNQGSGNGPLVASVDAFGVGVRGHLRTYNFEQSKRNCSRDDGQDDDGDGQDQ